MTTQDDVQQSLTEIVQDTLIEGSQDWEIISVGPNREDWDGSISREGSDLILTACPQTGEAGEPYKFYTFKVRISLELVSVTDEVSE